MVYVIQALLTAEQGVTKTCMAYTIAVFSCQQNLYDIYHCCVYSEKLLMMDRVTVRNM